MVMDLYKVDKGQELYATTLYCVKRVYCEYDENYADNIVITWTLWSLHQLVLVVNL